jgi:outer membrane lipoprotein carrier protein
MHLALLLLLFAADGGAAAPPKTEPGKKEDKAVKAAVSAAVKTVLDRVQKFYEEIEDLKASFKQDVADPRYGRKQVLYGYVRLKKPGKMRWDFSNPEKKSFISDGKLLWVYEPEDEQVFKQTLGDSALPSTVAFLFGKGRLDKEFDVTSPEDGGGIMSPPAGEMVLRLTPKTPNSQYKHILFVVKMESGQVSRTVVFDHDGKVNSMTFTSVELNAKQPDAHFKFTPPKGVKVLDPSKMKH